ncbi:MAG: glyceraldehyde 3-phosphate dehydrogenase NAD-binding domain-containing protein [Chloroflexota bacterium]
MTLANKRLLGVNGLGRIGKLTLWYHLQTRHFDGLVINVGRGVGKSLTDIVDVIRTDSTYGSLAAFLRGRAGEDCVIEIIDEAAGVFTVDGLWVKILRSARNPKDIRWVDEGVRLVVDCTGKFVDPTIAPDHKQGSIRGHLECGAESVIVSAPFKIKDSSARLPADSKTFVYGINHLSYDPTKHRLISAASCTTTALAHMMKPLLDTEETSRILTASMSTVHAATNTQSILDSVPGTGAGDLRKNRSVLNNVILTSTGAAETLEQILPEIGKIGFMADSVRIPTNTVSLICLNVTFYQPLTDNGLPVIDRAFINNIYKEAAVGAQKGLLTYSDKQNVSSDFIGFESAVVIEGHETHLRTAFMSLPAGVLAKHGLPNSTGLEIPVTHAKIFGWYDNEYGSYVTSLGKLTIHVDKSMR